jgi:hypothetical protein
MHLLQPKSKEREHPVTRNVCPGYRGQLRHTSTSTYYEYVQHSTCIGKPLLHPMFDTIGRGTLLFGSGVLFRLYNAIYHPMTASSTLRGISWTNDLPAGSCRVGEDPHRLDLHTRYRDRCRVVQVCVIAESPWRISRYI